MSVTWTSSRSALGELIPGEHEGVIKGEPAIRLQAGRYSWAVYIDGVEARSVVLSDTMLARASRKASRDVDAIEYAKRCAEAWARDVIARRDSGVGDGLP